MQGVPHQQEEVADVGEGTVTEESVAEGEDISSITEEPVQSREQDAVSDSEQQFGSEEVQQTEEPVQTAEKKTVEKADTSNPKTKSDDEVDEKARKERVDRRGVRNLGKNGCTGHWRTCIGRQLSSHGSRLALCS